MISVIVPIYNTDSEYLRQCVKSVLAQTFTDWELILVDDGSAPATATLCDRLAALDHRIRVIHTPNGGPSVARNTGIDNASGDFFTFLDPDDMLHRDFLATLIKPLLANPQVKISICKYVNFNNSKLSARFLEYLLESSMSGIKHKLLPSHTVLRDMLYQKRISSSVCDKVFRRDIFSTFRFTPGIAYEDLDIMYRILDDPFTVATLNIPLYLYRQHSESFLGGFSPKHLDNIRVTDRIVAYFQHREPDLLLAARHRQYSAYFNILTLLYAHRPDDRNNISHILPLLRERSLEILRNPGSRFKNRIGALMVLLKLQRCLPAISRIRWSNSTNT